MTGCTRANDHTRRDFHTDTSPSRGSRSLAIAKAAGAVAQGAVPRGGVRDGVLPLWVLLAGVGLLWGALPRDRATPSTATARHQRSVEGRLDHRDRQRVYRAQCRLRRVTDAPSPAPPRSTTIASPVGRHAASRPVCLVCGRLGGVTTRGQARVTRETGRRAPRKADDGNS